MSLRLILTRHAKSAWDNPFDTDHARPLNPRGRAAAPRVGRWLVTRDYLPDAALVSDAARTRETWARLSAEFPAPVPAEFLPALYHASPDTMLRILRNAQARTVMMIGHNPGIAGFAAELVAARPVHEGFARYPTCATLVVDFAAPDWSELQPGTGVVQDFIVPRELE
jgi:phosphohistidine phosphatase